MTKKDQIINPLQLNTLDTPNYGLLNDKIGIKEQLNQVINLIYQNTNAVIAIAAPYGCGKTFFAKTLEEVFLISQNLRPLKKIYINLWENDYKDPLITLITELSTLIQEEKEKNNFIEIATKSVFSLLSGVSVSGVKLDISKLKNLLNGEDKDNIAKLKSNITEIAEKKKVVFLIDEIDRCKPTFAVEFLETIKHFFSINNVVFVLFVNDSYLNNLNNRYQDTYGNYSNFINKYIHKTIYLNTNITNEFLSNIISESLSNYVDKNRFNITWISEIANAFNLSFRDIKQIFYNELAPVINKAGVYNAYTALLGCDKYGYEFLFFLYCCKITKPDILDSIGFKNLKFLEKLHDKYDIKTSDYEAIVNIIIEHPLKANRVIEMLHFI